MTIGEAQEKLKNTKVYVNGKSKEIQAKLFKLGIKWSSGDKAIMNEDKPFLYIEKSLTITFGSDMFDFSINPYKEISIKEILSIQVEDNLKPFDKVLVRNSNKSLWCISFYSHTVEDDLALKYVTSNGYHWIQCIPYEGNEDLVGTNKKAYQYMKEIKLNIGETCTLDNGDVIECQLLEHHNPCEYCYVHTYKRWIKNLLSHFLLIHLFL